MLSTVPAVQRTTRLPTTHRPDQMVLGWVQPDLEDVKQLAERFRQAVRSRAEEEFDPEEFLCSAVPLTYEMYCLYAPDHKELRRDFQRNGGLTIVKDGYGVRAFASLANRPWYTPDLEGYRRYLCALNEAMTAELAALEKPSSFPEAGRAIHTLVVARTGWGKSELLKTLAYHYARDDRAAVVVLDPGGDMCREMARWPELVRNDRAILIQPNLQPGKTFGLNPLDGTGLDHEGRTSVANFWAHQLGQLTSELTPQMERLARNCAHVLLAWPGKATLEDFVKLLRVPSKSGAITPRTKSLVDFAKRYYYPRVREFFNTDFDGRNFEQTRNGLINRLDWLLGLSGVEAMMCGTASFDLTKALEERKFVLVNLAAFGGGDKQAVEAVGKIFVAMLGAIGHRRQAVPIERRTPTHVFIDEVSELVSPALLDNLKALRKFGIYQTMAQQAEGDGFSPSKRKVLLANTGCKFIGTDDGTAAADVLKANNLPALAQQEFWVRWSNSADVSRLVVRSDLAGSKRTVPDEEWQAYEDRLVKRYYQEVPEYVPEVYDAAAERGMSLEDDDEIIPRGRHNLPLPPAKKASQRVAKPVSSRPHPR